MTSLRVDKYHLDDELQAIPEDIVEASKRVGAAKSLLRKQELDRRKALHNAKTLIRRDPAKYGLDRATIDAVNDMAAVFKSVLALDEQIIETQSAIDAAWSVLEGLRAKKESIGDLVGLFKTGYFARSPSRIDDVRPGGLSRKKRSSDDTGFEELSEG